jgi:hypothetical protein
MSVRGCEETLVRIPEADITLQFGKDGFGRRGFASHRIGVRGADVVEPAPQKLSPGGAFGIGIAEVPTPLETKFTSKRSPWFVKPYALPPQNVTRTRRLSDRAEVLFDRPGLGIDFGEAVVAAVVLDRDVRAAAFDRNDVRRSICRRCPDEPIGVFCPVDVSIR